MYMNFMKCNYFQPNCNQYMQNKDFQRLSKFPEMQEVQDICLAYIFSFVMYGSVIWALNLGDIQRFERVVKMMIRWACPKDVNT